MIRTPQTPAAVIGLPPGPALARPGRRRQAGFVLVFVLWVLAGCALLLAAYARSAAKPPVAEALASEPLRQAGLENAAEFVASHLDKDSVTADSRWVTENQIAEVDYNATNGGSAAASQLVEMLGQMGFKIDLPQGAQASATLSQLRQQLSTLSTGQTREYTLDPLFSQGEGTGLKVGKQTYRVSIAPVSRQPNLNKIPAKALKRYLRYLGLEDNAVETLAAALCHWRGDQGVLQAGQFDSEYHARGYNAPGREVADWSELSLLAGGSPDLTDFLRDHFSLAGPDARVDLLQVEPAMVAALADLDLETVSAAVTHLKGEHRDIALEDVIGAANTSKLDAAVNRSSPTDIPLRVKVSDGALSVSFVYDLNKHILSELVAGW